MVDVSGGVAAAFGFRYQYLVTVQILLDKFRKVGSGHWAIDVDRVGQNSADILVYDSVDQPPCEAIQVKASMRESSTTIGYDNVCKILSKLASGHPDSEVHKIITNRTLTGELANRLSTDQFDRPSFKVVSTSASAADLTEDLLSRIRKIRGSISGGVGRDLHFILLRQLIDIVHQAGSNTVEQRITSAQVQSVLEGSSPVLANAIGSRAWGKCVQVPQGSFVERNAVSDFLTKVLPPSAIFDGAPGLALIYGMSGSGKTCAAAAYSRSQVERFAFVLWLDASSQSALEAQVPMILERLGANPGLLGAIGDLGNAPAKALTDLLAELPVPWLLVLDNARSAEEVDEWVPRSGYGEILITSSRSDFPNSYAPSLRVEGFDSDEIATFFGKRLDPAADEDSFDYVETCKEIGDRLSGWPLALELAASLISKRGAGLSALVHFAKRLDRFDLGDQSLVPHGYPRTAVQVVLDLFEELSAGARLFVVVLELMGGRRVPARLLSEWARSMDIDESSVVDELCGASIVQREFIEANSPHEYDEVLSANEFWRLPFEGKEVAIEPDAINRVIEVSETTLEELVKVGRFKECASLVHPMDALLKNLVSGLHENLNALVRLSILMHNLAQAAVVTSNSGVSRRWYISAFRVREMALGETAPTSGQVRMQLETLSGASTVFARDADQRGIAFIADNACRLLEAIASESDYAKIPGEIVEVLCSNVGAVDRPAASRIAALALSPNDDDVELRPSAGNSKIFRVQHEMEIARTLVLNSSWGVGVARCLSVANYALEEQILVDWIIDDVIDTSLLLIAEICRRPHDVPQTLLENLSCFANWFNENPIVGDDSQKFRIQVISSVASGDSSKIDRLLESAKVDCKLSEGDQSWVEIASAVSGCFERLKRRDMFLDIPDNVSIHYTVDGGDRVNYWQVLTVDEGLPILWVCTSSSITYDSQGKSDMLRSNFINAGLPVAKFGENLSVAVDGWAVKISGKNLLVTDDMGIEKVSADSIEDPFRSAIRGKGGLLLAYGDLPLVDTTGDLVPHGWVPMVGFVERSSNHDSVGKLGVNPVSSLIDWLMRSFNWRRG